LALRTRRFRLLSWLDAQFTRGADIEVHVIDQAQNLIELPNNVTWDRRVDAGIRTFRAGLFLDGVVSVTKKARLHGGLRTDVVLFQVHDRLSNGLAAGQEATFNNGVRRMMAGVALGPRVTLEVDPRPYLRLSAAYGQGYRSPQALQLEETDDIPFAKVHSYEVGARFKAEAKRLSAAFIVYETRLSDDWAFDATPGRYVRIGSTVRRGFVTYIQAEPVHGLKTSFSATYVRATLDGPIRAENSAPAYVEGQALPFVPPVLVRVDVKYERPIIKIAGKPLIGRIGYGATFASPRPLPHGLYAQPIFTLDATASLRRDPVEIGIDAVNLFDRRYADTEYVFASNWGNASDVPSQLPTKHLSAGSPLTVMGTATFRF
jgi:outer membrane receptor protein involved in Fe transport